MNGPLAKRNYLGYSITIMALKFYVTMKFPKKILMALDLWIKVG
jgi:hypothetical protein